MTGTRTASLVVASLLIAASAKDALAAAAPTKIRWEGSYAAALKKAKAEKKIVMIDFWADWCHWCFELDKKTYRDADVVKRAQELVAVKVDREGSRAERLLGDEYRVETLPTIAFVSPQGHMIFRVDGYKDGPEFSRVMDHAQKKAADVLAWEAALESNAADAAAMSKLGGHLFDVEFYEDARTWLRKAADGDKDRPAKERKRTRTLLGIILHFDNKPAEAETVLNEALALTPADPDEDPAALFTLAKVQMKTDRNKEARANLQKIVEKFPESKPAVRARETLDTLPAK